LTFLNYSLLAGTISQRIETGGGDGGDGYSNSYAVVDAFPFKPRLGIDRDGWSALVPTGRGRYAQTMIKATIVPPDLVNMLSDGKSSLRQFTVSVDGFQQLLMASMRMGLNSRHSICL
jgi:hypothetical protein